MLNNMLGNAMKMLEKEMRSMEKSPRSNFKLMINGKEIQIGQQKKPKEAVRKIQKRDLEKNN